MRRGARRPVAHTARDSSIRRVVEQQRGKELQPRLELREVDAHPFASLAPPVERGGDERGPVAGADKVGIGPVGAAGLAVGPADDLREARQRDKLRAESRLHPVRPGLALVRRAEVDDAGVHLAGRLVAQTEPLDRPRSKALRHHVGPRDEAFGDVQCLGVLQIEACAQLTAVVVGEEAAAVDPRLAVAERHGQPQEVGALDALDPHHRGPVVGQVAHGDRADADPREVGYLHPLEGQAHQIAPSADRIPSSARLSPSSPR